MTNNRLMHPRTRPSHRRRGGRGRSGAVLIWCAFLLVVLLGMVGLVIDGGMLLASHRHAQNAADAGALAAAVAMLRDEPIAAAKGAGVTAVTDPAHNNLPNATVTINIPPTQGPYTGSSTHAEAILSNPIPTFFIHVLPGATRGATVRARAVAGYEEVQAGKGVMTLNPDARPGLKISGQATLKVYGDVIVNSEGGGVDENGDPVIVDSNQTATTVNNNGHLYAENVEIVGGVNANGLDDIENIVPGDPSPLHANQLPEEDPLRYMPTPTTSNGVVDVERGAPQASNGSLALNNGSDASGSPNYIETDGSGVETMVLQPGIYEQITISGGNVRFEPGIYVLRPTPSTSFVLSITGGNVTADGIMFYNTGDNYDPANGAPDNADYLDDQATPPPPDGAHFGDVKINDSTKMLPLDTTGPYDYSAFPSSIDAFDGMLFYQRRLSDAGIQIEGNSSDGELTGSWYAKWGDLSIDGQGTYKGNFVVGSLKAEGQATMVIDPNGQTQPKALRLFLVE